MIDLLYVTVSSANIRKHIVMVSPGDLFEVRKAVGGSHNIVLHQKAGLFVGQCLKVYYSSDWTAIKACYELSALKGGKLFRYLRPLRPNQGYYKNK